MFAKYVSAAGAAPADIVKDLAALACGTAIAALSAACDKVNSAIQSNVVAPGWTLVDTDGTGAVISCPDADNLVTKLVRIQTVGSGFTMKLPETWDPVAHAGTNLAPNPSGPGPIFANYNQPNTIYVFATPRTFYTFYATGLGVSIGCVEYTRDAAHLKGSHYPCHALINNLAFTQGGANEVTSYRIKNLSAAGDSLGPIDFSVCTIAARSNSSGVSIQQAPYNKFRDAVEGQYYEVRPVFMGWVAAPAAAWAPLYLGRIYDFIETASVAGNMLNTLTDGVDTWTIVTDDSLNPNACVAIKAL